MPKLLTDDQIERRVERAIDALDKRFMNGDIGQLEYDMEIVRIDRWSYQQYYWIYR